MSKQESMGAVYRFKIDTYSPDTMPMARLAQYMTELSNLLGEQKSVHFARLEKGSTVIVHKVEREAVPKVRERAAAVIRNEAVPEALRAYRAVNKLLREDNAIGVLRERSAQIIRFPGREIAEERYPTISQQGSIDGVVVSVGGADNTVHVRLMVEGQTLSGCQTSNRILAKELAQRFDEPVRLIGMGKWNRDPDGKWSLADFRIDSFEPLNDAPLSDALEDLRRVPLGLDQGAYEELNVIRHGPLKRTNGGH